MASCNKSHVATIHDIPQNILMQILEQLSLLDQHEAGMVNTRFFECVYKNPHNLKVLSLFFGGNVYLCDGYPPINYFINSNIPYKRLVFGSGVGLGCIEKFSAKIGETLEDLVIKYTNFPIEQVDFAFTGDEVAHILANMKQLKTLEINWKSSNLFMKGYTLPWRQYTNKVQKALESVTEFRLIAHDVQAHQFWALVEPMKNLQSLFVEIHYTESFYNRQDIKIAGWPHIMKIVKKTASTLRHLFIDLRFVNSLNEIPVCKSDVLQNLLNYPNLKLTSFSIHMNTIYHSLFLSKVFMKFSETLTTLGPISKNDNRPQPMEVAYMNLNTIVNTLPKLQHINIEVSCGLLKDMTFFNHLSDLRSLNVSLEKFNRSYHIFHESTSQLLLNDNSQIQTKMKKLKITGPLNNTAHREACNECIYFMVLIYPNITQLELNINSHNGVTNDDMHLIFHYLVNLEVLGITSCSRVTDAAFSGTFITELEDLSTSTVQKETFSIGNLTHLKTLLLYPLEKITNIAFIEGFSKLKKLQNFALNGVNHVTSEGIVALVDGCTKLEVVYFENCENFDDNFVKYLINRLIYLKYIHLGGCLGITNDLKKFEGFELIGNVEDKSVIWKAHNSFKIGKGRLPLNVFDLEQ